MGAVRLITFDMSRAFDRVPHDQLLPCISKLTLPNIHSFVNWLNSYLSDRQQQVKLGEKKVLPLMYQVGYSKDLSWDPYFLLFICQVTHHMTIKFML